jgi:cytochrome c oxidase cbb3-type subunit 3
MLLDGGGGAESHPPQTQYEQQRVVCHGANGSGNNLLGAPKPPYSIWLYSGDANSIQTTLRNGRFGEMPALNERLDGT